MSDLGQFIKKRRQELGFSAADLATAIGVTSQAVGNWETQDREPSKALLPKLADALGVSIGELLGRRGEQRPVDETQLLNYFRQLNKEQQDTLIVVAKALASQET